MTMTTVINTAIGESKNTTRIWLEGESLRAAGLKIGTYYRLHSSEARRMELREAEADYEGQKFKVSKRLRHGVLRPLFEVRTALIGKLFEQCEKVRVAIRNGIIVITASHLAVRIAKRVQSFLSKMRSGEPLETCSMFHGGGIMDKALHHGFKRAGVDSFVKVAIEIERAYLSSSLRNNPELFNDDSIAVCSDVRDADLHHNTPSCNLFASGIPCTGASIAGAAKLNLEHAEDHEDAGTMFFDVLEGIKAMNPIMAIMECVQEYLKTASMAVIRSRLKSLGYRLYETVLTGNDFGVLENRRRMIVVAVCQSLPDTFSFEALSCIRTKEATINDILEPVALDAECWDEFKHLETKAVRDKAEGKGFAQRQLLNGTEDHCGTIGRGYAKGRSTEPFILHPENPKLMRLLNEREHPTVKGIPLSAVANESPTIVHEICGQSVVYPMLEAVGHGSGAYMVSAYWHLEGKMHSMAA